MKNEKWYTKTWVMWVLLIFFAPAGIVLMWATKKNYPTKTKKILTVVFALWFIFILAVNSGNKNEKPTTTTEVTTTEVTTTEETTTEETTTKETTEKTTEEESAKSKRDLEESKKESSIAASKKAAEESRKAAEESSIAASKAEEARQASIAQSQAEADRQASIAQSQAESQPPAPAAPAATHYILNTSTHKFHYPSCGDVNKIAPQNYGDFSGTRDGIIAQGYSPCGHCKP